MGKVKQKTASMKHITNEDFEFYHYRDADARLFDFKNHDVYEIFYLISGNATYLINGRSYKLKPGDVLLINSNELHKPFLEPGEIYERIIIWIKPEFLEKHSTESCSLSKCFEETFNNSYNLIRLNSATQKKFKNSVLLLEEACSSNEFGCHILKNAYLLEIIVYLNRYFSVAQEIDFKIDIGFNEKIDRVIKYIDENLTRDLSLDNISCNFYTNKYHLSHEFKKYTGYSIHQFIQQKRLIMAKALLKDGKTAIEACEGSGFGDYVNFIRSFKKSFGVPPGKYRKTYSL